MEERVNKDLEKLKQLSTICNNHKVSTDSYTSPAFTNFLERPVTIEDMPAESNNIYNKKEIGKDPGDIPWEDSIKNFIFDISSVQEGNIFSTCILLFERGYDYAESTELLVCKKFGKSIPVAVSAIPVDDSLNSFNIKVIRGGTIEYQYTTESNYLVSNLTIWYARNSTLLLCHNSSIEQYKEAILMMPDITWSISCNFTNFIESQNENSKCVYVLPVFSHIGSTETRAVGSGPVNFCGHKRVNSYIGRVNYYSRSIRGSKHTSGRCYDCEILSSLVKSLGEFHDDNENSMNKGINFEASFLEPSEGI